MPRRIRLTLVQTCILLLLALSLALAQSTPKRGGTFLWFDYADPARLDLHTGSPLNVSQAIVGIYSGLV
jgi:ABC-type oligopeptide transport system substrate-binding subunit